MSMEPDLLFWIINNISQKKTILEFGSGNATVTLSKFFKMISVEENIEFVEKVKEACPSDSPIKFIHAPVGSPSEWYDAQTIKEQLSTQKYDVIIIDGPAYGSRTEFLNNLDIFDLNKTIIVDDIDRPDGLEIWNYFLNKKIDEYWPFRHRINIGRSGIIFKTEDLSEISQIGLALKMKPIELK